MKQIIPAILVASAVLLTPVSAFAATLKLTPETGTYNKNCNVTLNIMIDTQGAEVDGTDAILEFDQSKFTYVSFSKPNPPFFPEYQPEDASIPGTFSVSALGTFSAGVRGSGVLGTVTFKVKDNAPAGATAIKFDFDPNDKAKTTDSNVAERGTTADVLAAVTDGNYTIGTGTACTGVATPSPSGFGGIGRGGPETTPSGSLEEVPIKKLPDSALTGPTLVLTIAGTILTLFGIAGLALL